MAAIVRIKNGMIKRRVRVAVGPTLIQEILTKGWSVKNVTCTEGLPPTAKFISIVYDATVDLFYLIFDDDSFAIVPVGQFLPIIEVQYRIEY